MIFLGSPERGGGDDRDGDRYLTREGWTGLDSHSSTGFVDPKATNNMLFTGFRYYIP